ncbi:HigA family addiction module antitoxin [Ilyobacter sp.]|uniref:HigA family addiction module antitoxin n=1 Tax=Ilyobacter sp. TaxID=3100343 RepID=UPI00356B08D9
MLTIRKPDVLPILPGETIREELEARGMTQVQFSKRMGMTTKAINELIKGKTGITYENATKLKNVLGASVKFWINLDVEYREELSILSEFEDAEEEIKTANKIPYLELIKRDHIKRTKNALEVIEELKRFFSVDSLNFLPNVEKDMFDKVEILFRKDESKEICEYSMATWLRIGELKALEVETKPFNKAKIKELIPKFRKLTRLRFEDAISELKNLCAEVGIAVVVEKHFPKTFVSGLTKWVGKEKALILLSVKGNCSDIFWFSFFHELGHVLNHNKKDIFINFENNEAEKLEIEREADEFAKESLIPNVEYRKFLEIGIDKNTITAFSDKLGIHPGILVGRLQKEKKIIYSQYNDLKQKIS